MAIQTEVVIKPVDASAAADASVFCPQTVTIGNQVWMAENLAVDDGGEGHTAHEKLEHEKHPEHFDHDRPSCEGETSAHYNELCVTKSEPCYNPLKMFYEIAEKYFSVSTPQDLENAIKGQRERNEIVNKDYLAHLKETATRAESENPPLTVPAPEVVEGCQGNRPIGAAKLEADGSMDKYYLLVDIDGTLSDVSKRAKTYLEGDKPDWDGFYAACGDDAPITPVIRIIEALARAYAIVFCTGRRESCEATTREWMVRHMPALAHCPILFRKDGDHRHDTVVKPELLEAYMKENHKKQLYAVFEDRDSMVAKWRELGYTCFQPAAGNF